MNRIIIDSRFLDIMEMREIHSQLIQIYYSRQKIAITIPIHRIVQLHTNEHGGIVLVIVQILMDST